MLMSLPVSELKNYSLLTLTLPSNYGYCIFVAVGSILVIEWKFLRVEEVRRKHHMPDPVIFSLEDDFNSYSMGYQRMLERFPQFLTLLLIGGLDSPVVAAVGGTIWVVEKTVSEFLSNTTETKKHFCSALSFVGWMGMIYSTTKLALRLLQLI